MSKFVLGGGLSGLITAYYNPEYTVVSPEYGGFIDTKFGQAFVVLHGTEEMRELFHELGVPCFEKTIEIGYYHSDWGEVRTDLGDEEEAFARRYVEEKLPPRFQPGKDLELSAPGSSWDALFVDSSIVKALANEVEARVSGWVEDFGNGEMTIHPTGSAKDTVEYDDVVSTLPATLFQRLADVDWELDHEPTTYAELKREKVPDRYLDKPWNILYVVDESVEYHRIVRNMLSSRYYVECLGDVDVYGSIDSVTNETGVISDEDIRPPNDDVSFLGRYAEWNHEKRIDHVIKEAKQL